MPEMRKVFKNSLLPLLLGCGLFFVNIRPTHDWGDDFAQYLQQSENIVNGDPIEKSGYIHNPDFLLLGPKAYPPGFPALLSISGRLFQNEIIGGQYLISFFLLLFGWVFFLLLQRYKVPWLLSLIAMLSLIYHPWMLEQKAQLLSDIPFGFFLLLAIYLARPQGSKRLFFIAGLAAAMAICIRSIGWILPLAGVLVFVLTFWPEKKADYKYLILAVTAALGSWLINLSFGYVGSSQGYGESLSLSLRTAWQGLAVNASHYWDNLRFFVEIKQDHWHFIMLPIQLLLLLSALWGLRQFRKYPLLIGFLLGYLLLLLVFPFKGGFRFLLPILPLLFFLALTSISGIAKWPSYFTIGLLLLLNVAYQPYRVYIQSQQDVVQEGPQMKEVKELFAYIRQNLHTEDVVAFSKPRALSYYTGVKTVSTLWEIDMTEFEKQVKRLGANHYLRYSEIEYYALNEFVEDNQSNLKAVFSNSRFTLYKEL